MPKIHAHNNLTGQVGSVIFTAGVGETDDEHMLAYFADNAEAYTVEGAEPSEPAEPSWDDLTDEELDEAYATTVPDGGATTRKGKLKALHALDA